MATIDSLTCGLFWSKVAVSDIHSCWNWKAGFLNVGYGKHKWGGKTWGAHRFSWFICNGGAIPEGMHILHTCDNRKCVNPTHLFTGTNADNMKDRDMKRRLARRAPHEKKLSAVLVRDIRNIKGETQASIAKRYGVHITTIERVISRKYWAHVV